MSTAAKSVTRLGEKMKKFFLHKVRETMPMKRWSFLPPAGYMVELRQRQAFKILVLSVSSNERGKCKAGVLNWGCDI